MSDKNKLKLVEDFIYNDEVQNILSNINDNVMDFNILEITGMGTQEIKHSNILGWLFDNSEHNLEYQILDDFLKKVIQEKDNECSKLHEYIYLANNKRDITIYREKDNIDLLVVDEANKIVVTIENKINADERVELADCDSEKLGQLDCYEKKVNKKYPKFDKYFIFLTIDSKEPSKEHWLKASHQMITDIIEDILRTKEINVKTKIILESYVDLLKRNGIVEDKNLEKFCNKVWANKKYAEAIDILLENRITPLNNIFAKLKEKYNFDGRYGDLELDGVKKLYKKFGKKWEDSEQIFEVQLTYLGGKDESIWLGYWYPDLEEEFKNICEKIINKNITQKRYGREFRILRIDKKYIADKDDDTVVKEIVDKIQEIDAKIIKILK